MERLKRAKENARHALDTLEQILEEPAGGSGKPELKRMYLCSRKQ
jgi:hypothetical protein